MATHIEWLGHCSFRIISESGLRILIDPFNETIGLKVAPYECDILLISHSHYDSSARHLVTTGYEEMSEKGSRIIEGITFKALQSYHDDRLGKDYGTVLVFIFELDGIKFGYLSHIGIRPKEAILDELKDLDICFVPVGGVLALDPTNARVLMNELKPKLIFPMHFSDRYLNFTLLGIGEFTRLMSKALGTRRIDNWIYEVNKEEFPEEPEVVLMQHWPGVSGI
jgi:L-ascorbate metabolism protein UlaG (beta-lactamase superfamily)